MVSEWSLPAVKLVSDGHCAVCTGRCWV